MKEIAYVYIKIIYIRSSKIIQYTFFPFTTSSSKVIHMGLKWVG
jgi:hypothetical protein